MRRPVILAVLATFATAVGWDGLTPPMQRAMQRAVRP